MPEEESLDRGPVRHVTLKDFVLFGRKLEKLDSLTRDSSTNDCFSLLNDLVHIIGLDDNNSRQIDNGFYFFSQLRSLSANINKFIDDLALQDKEDQGLALFDQSYQTLENLRSSIKEKSEKEVECQPILIPESAERFRKYQSPNQWFWGTGSKQTQRKHELIFYLLPQVAQIYFEDAGKCLAYGLPRASLALGLQAVEASLRYYYNRFKGGENDTWGDMLDWLKEQKHRPTEECITSLYQLKETRNQIAHGRDEYQFNTNAGKVETTLINCRQAVISLFREAHNQNELRIRIRINPDFAFETAVAAYIFKWNRELPPHKIEEMVIFDQTIGKYKLVDQTFPGSPCFNSKGEHLVMRVCKHLRIQPSYLEAIKPLVEYATEHSKEQKGGVLQAVSFEVDLADLFRGLKYQHKGPPVSILSSAWEMFDTFLQLPSPDPRDPKLIQYLGLEHVYYALAKSEHQNTMTTLP